MTNNTEKTIAEKALEKTEAKVQSKTADSKKPISGSKFKAGLYRSDKFLRIIKTLSFEHQKDANGQIQKTYGTWAKDDNMIVFNKGIEKRLTDEDLSLPNIQRLIESKTIYRVGD